MIKKILLFFIPLRRFQNLYLMTKQQEVNRTDIVGYRNTEEKTAIHFNLKKKKRTAEEETFFSHQK